MKPLLSVIIPRRSCRAAVNSSFLHSTFITFIPRVTYIHVQLYTVYFGGPLHLKRAIPNAHRLWTDVINLCYTVASYPKGYNDETIRMLQSIIHVLPIAYPFAQCFNKRYNIFLADTLQYSRSPILCSQTGGQRRHIQTKEKQYTD